MAGVQLHAVVSRPIGALGGSNKIAFNLLDLRNRQFAGTAGVTADLYHTVAGTDAVSFPCCQNAGMTELNNGGHVCLVKDVDQLTKTVYLTVIPETELIEGEASFAADAGCLLDNKTRSAVHKGAVVGEKRFRHTSVLAAPCVDDERRHADAAAQSKSVPIPSFKYLLICHKSTSQNPNVQICYRSL